jgi:hypothetical protein
LKKNCYSATATASRITKVPAEVIRGGFRKGAKPTGNVLNAVIVARQLNNGTFHKAAVAAKQAAKSSKTVVSTAGIFLPVCSKASNQSSLFPESKHLRVSIQNDD